MEAHGNALERDQKKCYYFYAHFHLHTVVTEKQREAMVQAKVNYVYMPIYGITYAEVKKLLGV